MNVNTGLLTGCSNFLVKHCLCIAVLFCFGCSGHVDEEEHHLEHVIPAHKPADFSEAIIELHRRGEVDLSNNANQKQRSELLDIINWLPELAADSDLKRAQWELVRDTTLELRNFVNSTSQPESTAYWKERVQILEELVPDSETWRPSTEGESQDLPNETFIHSTIIDEQDHD